MPRRRKADGKKPSRNSKAKHRLRELLPKVGFDCTDKRCRAVLSGVDSGTIKGSLPWTSDALTGHAVFSLVVALVFSHEKYDAACPYDRFKHQYGKLATAVHEFSGLLKQHYGDNMLVMSFYYDSSVSLHSDEEDDDDDDDETDVEEAEAGLSQGQEAGAEAGDVAMPDYQGEGAGQGEGEGEGERETEDRGEELAGAVKAMELD